MDKRRHSLPAPSRGSQRPDAAAIRRYQGHSAMNFGPDRAIPPCQFKMLKTGSRVRFSRAVLRRCFPAL